MADDSTIAQELASRFRQAKTEGDLKDFRIGVKVEDGVVWLSGTSRTTVSVSEHWTWRVGSPVSVWWSTIWNVKPIDNGQQSRSRPSRMQRSNRCRARPFAEEYFEESTNVPARHVALSVAVAAAPRFVPAARVGETAATGRPDAHGGPGAPPLPPGAIVLVPGYSAVPAYPVQPVCPADGSARTAATKPVRSTLAPPSPQTGPGGSD